MILSDMDLKVIATLVIFSAVVNCDSSFPTTINRCKYADVKCLENMINKVIQSSPGGIPDIDLSSVDPLFIGKATIEQGASSSAVNIKVRMKNASMVGIKQFVVNKAVGFEKDPNTSKFEIHGFCPKVTIVGDYQITGKVLVVPVNGHGIANISLYDNAVKVQLITHTEMRNGTEYLVVDNVAYSSNAKRMFLNLDNLFNDPVISENMNRFFNENQDILHNELKASMHGIFGNILKNRIEPVFRKFAYRELFLN